jgi:hypothetical protein
MKLEAGKYALEGESINAGAGGLVVNAVVIPAQRRATTRAALLANRELIVINVEAVLLFLDEKIATLDRANSDEARAELEQYRYVKRELEKFRLTNLDFAAGKVPEEAAIEASFSFSDGIRGWWKKYHAEICNTAFSASVFLSCIGICHLTGTEPNLGAVISGVIAKGKPITDALKSAADLIFGPNQKR